MHLCIITISGNKELITILDECSGDGVNERECQIMEYVMICYEVFLNVGRFKVGVLFNGKTWPVFTYVLSLALRLRLRTRDFK